MPDTTPPADPLSRTIRLIGDTVAWIVVPMVVGQFALVVLRYAFGIGSIAGQEAVLYGNGLLFMVGAAALLSLDRHVRVDVFYRRWGPRRRALVDAAGSLFLTLPLCIAIGVYSWPYVAASWAVGEASRETSGLPGVYLYKSLLLVFAVLVGIQAMLCLIRDIRQAIRPTAAHAG